MSGHAGLGSHRSLRDSQGRRGRAIDRAERSASGDELRPEPGQRRGRRCPRGVAASVAPQGKDHRRRHRRHGRHRHPHRGDQLRLRQACAVVRRLGSRRRPPRSSRPPHRHRRPSPRPRRPRTTSPTRAPNAIAANNKAQGKVGGKKRALAPKGVRPEALEGPERRHELTNTPRAAWSIGPPAPHGLCGARTKDVGGRNHFRNAHLEDAAGRTLAPRAQMIECAKCVGRARRQVSPPRPTRPECSGPRMPALVRHEYVSGVVYRDKKNAGLLYRLLKRFGRRTQRLP